MADEGPTSKVKKIRAIKQKGKAFRQQEPLLAVIQWGVDRMLQECHSVPEKALILQQDFSASSKISVANHLYNDHDLPSRFTVKEYSPLVFRDLRHRFKESPDDFIFSICEGPLEAREPSGKSSAALYTTHDKRLVLKTLSREEVSQFHITFSAYHKHIVEAEGDTLLPRYLGMYRISVHDGDTYVVVMNNVFCHMLESIPRTFDLKGSTVDRRASDKERAKTNPVLKDNDFAEAGLSLHLGPARAVFCDKLARDTRLLESLKLMDYSLLVGVYDHSEVRAEQEEAHPDDGQLWCGPYCIPCASTEQEHLYCVGIIDALTLYNAKKKAAHAAKTAKHGRAEFSTVNPEQYAKRFIEYVSGIAK